MELGGTRRTRQATSTRRVKAGSQSIHSLALGFASLSPNLNPYHQQALLTSCIICLFEIMPPAKTFLVSDIDAADQLLGAFQNPGSSARAIGTLRVEIDVPIYIREGVEAAYEHHTADEE